MRKSMEGKRMVSILTAAAVPALASDVQTAAAAGTTASAAAIAQSDLTVTAAASSYTYEPTKVVYYEDTGSGMVKTETGKYTYKNNRLKKYVSISYTNNGSTAYAKETETYSNFDKYGNPKKIVATEQDGSGTSTYTYTCKYTYNKKGQITKKVAKQAESDAKETTTFTYKNGKLRKEVCKYSATGRVVTAVYSSKGALKSYTDKFPWRTTKQVYSNYDKNLNPQTTKVTNTSSSGNVTKETNTTAYKYYKGKYVKQSNTTGDSESSKIVYSGFVKIRK